LHPIKQRIKLICIKPAGVGTTLKVSGISAELPHTLCFPGRLFLFLAPIGVMLDNVVQIFEDRGASNRLRMKTGDNTRDFLLFDLCVLMIEKEQILSAVDDDPPIAVLRMYMKLAIVEVVGDVVFMTELIYCLLLSAEPDAHYRTAIAHAIAGLSCFFLRYKASLVFFANASSIYTVRKVENLITAFSAVKYHGRQLLPYLLTP